MDRTFCALGSWLAALGVAAGAFGAHALKGRLSPEMLGVFETGVHYHLIHALALIGAAWACGRWAFRLPVAAGWFFVSGIVLFSGSLYALALTGERWLGAVTPFGGVAFLAGWVCLALGVTRRRGGVS